MHETGRVQVARSILTYLIENRNAQDTMAGIVEWWVVEQQIKTETAAVRTALAELVARGLIIEREGKDSQVHYRINDKRVWEIEAIIKQDWDD
jgi:DNA-binding transcriptional regulator PaaX